MGGSVTLKELEIKINSLKEAEPGKKGPT